MARRTVLAVLAFAVLLAVVSSPSAVRSSDRPEAVARVVEAAQALLSTIPEEPGFLERMTATNRTTALRHLIDDEAREDWSYWPRPRKGLTLGQMDRRQRQATQNLLEAVLSSRGQLKVMHIVQLERLLQQLDTAGLPRELGNYSLALFGIPEIGAPWGFRFEGHHVSLNLSVTPKGIRVTPSFLGANPSIVANGPLSGLRILRLEEDLGRALATSLTSAQQAEGILEGAPPRDILSGGIGVPAEKRDDWKSILQPDGISYAELDDAQRQILAELLDEILGTYRADVVEHYRARIDLETVHFAWLGSLEVGEPHYYRLQTGDFVFEYDNVQGNATHVHTVWRDRSSDFGVDLLEAHYRDEH